MTPLRLLLACPGRGSYGRPQLGTLQKVSPTLDFLDSFRAGLGRPTLRQLDAAERYSPSTHMAGENASILTFGATLADLEALDPARARLVAVTGNSMGWYTALAAAGALDLASAAELVEFMGVRQAGNVIGGQILYPVCGEDWRPDPALQARVDALLAEGEGYLSIRLGGTVVLAGTEAWCRSVLARPELKTIRGAREYPVQLPFHSAFHTPLLEEASVAALAELRLPFAGPAVPMVDGRGALWHDWSDPEALRAWTLGAQVTDTFDFGAALATALGEFGPDAVLVPGPGDTLGAPVAQTMIRIGWRGLRDQQDFLEAQSGDRPVVISMSRPEQRSRVCLA